MAYAFHAHLIHWLTLALPPDKQKQGLITLSVAEPFLTAIQVSIYAGFILAMPVILWQVWAFFSPAIQTGSRRTIVVAWSAPPPCSARWASSSRTSWPCPRR